MTKTKLWILLALIIAVPLIFLALTMGGEEGSHSVKPPEGVPGSTVPQLGAPGRTSKTTARTAHQCRDTLSPIAVA